jgi:hypothetical protein
MRQEENNKVGHYVIVDHPLKRYKLQFRSRICLSKRFFFKRRAFYRDFGTILPQEVVDNLIKFIDFKDYDWEKEHKRFENI